MYDNLPTSDNAEDWTLEECAEYVALKWESHGEMSAEAGMGAMSLGYGQDGAYEAASAVPQPADDPLFVIANRRLEEARAASRPAPASAALPWDDDSDPLGIRQPAPTEDDIPF